MMSTTWVRILQIASNRINPAVWSGFQLENDSSGILRSRGHNFLSKNVEIFEIHQNFAEIGRFECGISPEDPKSAALIDFPLRL